MIWIQVAMIFIFTALFVTALIQGELTDSKTRRFGLWVCLVSSVSLLVLTGFWLIGSRPNGYYVAVGYFGLEAGLIILITARLFGGKKR